MRPPTEHQQDPLIALARAFLDGEPCTPALAESDWDRTVSRAEQERLAPVLYRAVRSGAAPAPVVARLRAAWLAAERQRLLAEAQLGEILRAFEEASLSAILLKGPALARDYYADPALRPFTDLDFLVQRRHRAQAIDILTGLGYVHASPGRSLAYELEHAPAAYFVMPGDSRLPVDLHWECVAHPGASQATELTAEEIWSRALPSPSWGAAARTLAPEDLIVYLAAHLAIHHSLAGALWQLDLGLVLRRHGATLDWDAVVDRSRRWGAAGGVYFALQTVANVLGVRAPIAALNRLRPGTLRAALIERLQRGGAERLVRLEYLVGLLLLDRPPDIARMVFSSLVPPPGWLRSRYDSRSVAAAYVTHYGRMARMLARGLRLQRS